jgi:hypothetical protein
MGYMQIKVIIQNEVLNIRLVNNTTEDMIIPDIKSRQGWGTLTFRLKRQGADNDILLLKPEEREWTGSGSSNTIKIEAGANHEFLVNVKDGWWEINEIMADLKDEEILMQAALNTTGYGIDKNGVVDIELQSDWISSKPPHKWLFSDHHLQLKLTKEYDKLFIALSNVSGDEINLWDFNNAWGWETLSFIIRSGDNKFFIKQRDKTFNDKPSFFKIAPGETKKFTIDLHEESWSLPAGIESLKNMPLEVKARLDVPVYPETKEYHAFFGLIQSGWLLCDPAHKWLFA